jgi:tetratricopeptide (TPR) repeat protein
MEWLRRTGLALLRQRHLVALAATVFAVAVAVRVVYWLQYAALPAGRVALGADVAEYDRWAREIVSGQWLWTELPIHGPLYPFLLAAAYRLTGLSVVAVRALQLGLDLLSLTFLALAVWRLLNLRAAVVAAALWALYQPLIYYSAELLCEGLVVLLLSGVLFCWALAHRPGGRRPHRLWPLAASSVLCGLAAITHPLTLFLSGPYLVWCVYSVRQRFAGQRRWAFAGLLAGLFALPILPVTLRNAWLSGELVVVQARAGLNLHLGNNLQATGTCSVRPGTAYEALVRQPLQAGYHGETGARRYYTKAVIAFVLKHPLRAAWLVLRKALLTWNAAEIPSGSDLPIMQALTPLMQVPLLRFGFVAPLALAGWAVARRRPRLFPLLWAPVCGTVALALLVTSGRYRLMLAPALVGSAALAVEGLWRAWQRDDRRSWSRAVALAMAGLLAAHTVPVPELPTAEVEAIALLAEAAWRVKEVRQAEHIARYGLTSNPHAAVLQHLLGNSLLEQGRHAEAKAALEAAVAADPERATALVDLGIALAVAGDDAQALAVLYRAAALPEAPADASYNLGVIYERQGRLDVARRGYAAALARDPVHASACLNLGLLLLREGQADEALTYLRRTLRLRPHDERALAGLAVYHAQRCEFAAAARFFEQALAANPNRDDVRAAYAAMREQERHECSSGP